MMAINIDWTKLKAIYKSLCEDKQLSPHSEIVFILTFNNNKVKKSAIRLKGFLDFFWLLENNPDLHIKSIVVQDKGGKTLYRHKQTNNGNEEIPEGGHEYIVRNWNTFKETEKELILKIMIAQIQGYE